MSKIKKALILVLVFIAYNVFFSTMDGYLQQKLALEQFSNTEMSSYWIMLYTNIKDHSVIMWLTIITLTYLTNIKNLIESIKENYYEQN